MRKLWGALLFWFRLGITEKRMRETLRDLSSLCLPPQMPGRVMMPDGYSAELVTTLAYLQINISDDTQLEGAKVTYWIDRERMVVLLPDGEFPLHARPAARPAYVLHWLSKWNPIIPSTHGLVGPGSFNDCLYTQGGSSEQTIVGKDYY